MRNTFLADKPAANAYGWVEACAPGTCLPPGVMPTLVRHRDVFASPPPSTIQTVKAAAKPTTYTNYQDKTRISAAGGGASGSPPAWDPV